MNRRALLGKALLEVIAEFAVFAALLFVSAGTLLWPAAWAFLALFFGFALAIVLWLAREDPELLQERMSSPIQRGQPLWDKVFVAAVLLLFLTWLIVMPLDAVRFGWWEVPGWLQLMGALGVVLSFYIMFLTFRENAYLSLVAKLQQERGQSVVSTGPYTDSSPTSGEHSPKCLEGAEPGTLRFDAGQRHQRRHVRHDGRADGCRES